jgi:hypothetical protein
VSEEDESLDASSRVAPKFGPKFSARTRIAIDFELGLVWRFPARMSTEIAVNSGSF